MAHSANILVREEEEESRQSPDGDRPNMRIVLLGKSVPENSGVGNFLLGRAAFDSEALPDVVERVGGRLKDRHVMVINCPQLLQTNISDHQITQTVRECVILSDPGPHVFILVLQHNNFTEEDRYRVKTILREFGKEAIKHTLVITTDEESPVKVNESIQQLNTECRGRNLKLDNKTEELHFIVSQRLEEILEENHGAFLKHELYDYKETAVDERWSRSLGSVRTDKEGEDSDQDDDGQHRDTYTRPKETKGNISAQRNQKLNLVLCGGDESLKDSISNHIRKKNRISLVELPALSQLSEEEAMRQTHRCVSLCDPGVHVFLPIIPYGPLNNEDKAEMEKIQRMFSSSISKHIMVLIIQDKNVISSKSSLETFIQSFGGRHFVLDNSLQIPALLQDVENMVKENKGSVYTSFMHLQAQVERTHRASMKTQPTEAGVAHDDLRIVLLGKTGVGKSATGNTILRRKYFKSLFDPSSVTRECQKETTEFNGRRITVIDTPGLFDTGVDNDETRKEIVKCVSMAAPGPHVFLLVIQLGRFTEEEKNAVKMIQETFGDKSTLYTILLFTRGDDLEGRRIEDFIEQDGSLKNITQQFGKRYHVFNNKNSEDQTQVSELLDKIDCLVKTNEGSFYTSEMFKLVEKNIKEEQERILKEKEEEIKRKEEEMKNKYEAEIEEIKKENQRERDKMQNELRKREEEFKKKEEEIKKETDENLREELQRKLEEKQKQFEEENERKVKALGEQQQNFIKYLEEKHEKEKLNLQEKVQCETREQAEREYRKRLETAVAKALTEVPYTARRARDWNSHVPVLGGAVGGLVGGVEDILYWIFFNNKKNKKQTN